MWSSRAPMHSRYSIRDEAAQQSESHHQCVTQYWWRYLTNDFRAWGYTCGLRSAPLQRAGRAIEQSRYAPRLRISWVIAASIHFARRFFCGYVNRCLTGRMVTCTNAITAGTASKISPIQNSKKIMMRNDGRLISVRVQ
jgi:hypothetical protein